MGADVILWGHRCRPFQLGSVLFSNPTAKHGHPHNFPRDNKAPSCFFTRIKSILLIIMITTLIQMHIITRCNQSCLYGHCSLTLESRMSLFIRHSDSMNILQTVHECYVIVNTLIHQKDRKRHTGREYAQ